jgi:hypothetical protein
VFLCRHDHGLRTTPDKSKVFWKQLRRSTSFVTFESFVSTTRDHFYADSFLHLKLNSNITGPLYSTFVIQFLLSLASRNVVVDNEGSGEVIVVLQYARLFGNS